MSKSKESGLLLSSYFLKNGEETNDGDMQIRGGPNLEVIVNLVLII